MFSGHSLCPACVEQEEAYFAAVERYLEEHPGATIVEVVEATGVPERKIISFLRAGRLIPKGGESYLECERCGRPVRSGRYCESCRTLLSSSLREAAGREEQPARGEAPLVRREERTGEKARMYTADRFRREKRSFSRDD